MNKENKKYMIPALVAIPFMFIWIFITVFLTGGREISDFTETDKIIFAGFIITELLTLAIMIICLTKAQKYNKNNINNNIKTPLDKRVFAFRIIAFLLIVATSIVSIILKNNFTSLHNLVGVITITTFLLPMVILAISIVINRIYVKRLNAKSLAKEQQYWLSLRENIEQSKNKMIATLKTLIWINDIFSFLLGLCAFVSAFGFGVISDKSFSIAPLLICYITLSVATSRIRLKTPSSYFDDKTYVSENEYPALYNLAKKAAKAVGCNENIKIALLDDFNAGAAKINKTISIQLGVLLLNSLSEDELYCVLLHEFSHVVSENKNRKINEYYDFIYTFYDNTNANLYYNITKRLFEFSDSLYNLKYKLYLYTISVLRENLADKAMALYGNNEMAASSLIKIKYYELYDWQKGTYDVPCMMESEKYDVNKLKNEVANFKKAIKSNAHIWNTLIENEIISRNASHPTLKMRLENLSVSKINVLNPEISEAYKKDCEKAIVYVSKLIEEQQDDYVERRKYFYLDSKETVEKWEKAGKPVIAQEYSDVCDALRCLGRNNEALELCERAIENLDNVASCYAYFIKGCFLLHSFDKSGIEYIYKAIEENSNYINEGLEIIGRFCCLTGQEDELEIYRERALTLTEKNMSIYSECGVLNPKDKLSTENLPEGMLENILEHITFEHKDNIEKIYLVRKTITENFFTSVFVIKMNFDTDEDTRYDILHRAFNYLDTCNDWQFSLFDYDDVKNVKVENIKNSCVYSGQ